MKVVSVVVYSTLLLLVFGIIISFSAGRSNQIEKSENVKVSLNKTRHDWGEVGINDGKVEAVFIIKNEGIEVLKLFNIETSCTCTTAQIFTGDQQSPLFGMRTQSGYIAEVPVGQTADLKAVFDPAFHGPSGTGPITRQITIETNDAAKPQLTAIITANVIK